MAKIKIIKKKRKSISKRLKRFLKKNNLEEVYWALRKLKNGKNYFDLSYTDPSKLSYLSAGRIPDKTHLIYDKDYRIKYAYHSRAGKILSGAVDNSVLQRLSALLYERAYCNNISIDITKNIAYWYDQDRYLPKEDYSDALLYNSCMRHSELYDAIKWYEEQVGDDTVKLLICRDKNGYLIGRALVWYNVCLRDSDEDKRYTYLDRIYAINDNITSMIENYGAKQGWLLYKDKHNYSMYINIGTIDEDIPTPYLDTFRYLLIDDGQLYANGYDYDVELCNVDGDTIYNLLNENRYIICAGCRERIYEEDIEYSETENCYLCENCGVYSEYYQSIISENRASWSEYENTYFHEDDSNFIYCEQDADYCLNPIYDNELDEYFLPNSKIYDEILREREEEEEEESEVYL